MKYFFLYVLYLTIIAATFGCKKPYNPPAVNSPNSYLVVEGAISGGSNVTTTIKLSRTVNLANETTVNPVTDAVLTVESDQNNIYPLTEIVSGDYIAYGLILDNAQKYRLRIKSATAEYLSDFVAVVNSPPIDSINYTVQSNGINIYSNTHDPNNNTRYYRWDYQETWIIHSNYDSGFISNGDTVLGRPADNEIYTCWQNDTSDVIVLNSSAKLAKDVIVNNLVTSIVSTSEKIGSKYSIMVTQYALTGDAYRFWTNLKKITEQLGSIFDAQPSQINGNIHSVTNPLEPVIGYISAGNTSSARIFITARLLPNWIPTAVYPNCVLDSFYYKYLPPGSESAINQVDARINYNRGAIDPEIPVSAIGLPGHPPVGYTASGPFCVDCTLRGTNIQPAFWK